MFEWDTAKAISNEKKHGVRFDEASSAFDDAYGLDWADLEHVNHESRFKRLAMSKRERILLIVYTYRRAENGQEVIRIISARQADGNERKAYAGQRD
jgi:uncharacterized protein